MRPLTCDIISLLCFISIIIDGVWDDSPPLFVYVNSDSFPCRHLFMSLRLSACGASCINKMNSIEYVCLSGHSYDIKNWIAYMKRATTSSEDIEAKNVRVIRHVRHMCVSSCDYSIVSACISSCAKLVKLIERCKIICNLFSDFLPKKTLLIVKRL